MTHSANELDNSNLTVKVTAPTTLTGILQSLTPDERRVVDMILESHNEQYVIENWKYIKNQMGYYVSISC